MIIIIATRRKNRTKKAKQSNNSEALCTVQIKCPLQSPSCAKWWFGGQLKFQMLQDGSSYTLKFPYIAWYLVRQFFNVQNSYKLLQPGFEHWWSFRFPRSQNISLCSDNAILNHCSKFPSYCIQTDRDCKQGSFMIRSQVYFANMRIPLESRTSKVGFWNVAKTNLQVYQLNFCILCIEGRTEGKFYALLVSSATCV